MAIKHADFIRESTSTTGNGTITLTALTGWARFSNAFSVGDTVPYIIENGNNRETGIGTIGSSNTLTRTTVLSTLVSGTYNNTNPTAINLTSTSFVSCGPVAYNILVKDTNGCNILGSSTPWVSSELLHTSKTLSNTSLTEYGEVHAFNASNTSGAVDKWGVYCQASATSGYAGTGTIRGLGGAATSSLASPGIVPSMIGFTSYLSNSGSGTVTNAYGFTAATIGNSGGGVVTNYYGFSASEQTVMSGSTFGFNSGISAGTGKWNFYAAGTAKNYLAGTLLIGDNAGRSTTDGQDWLVVADTNAGGIVRAQVVNTSATSGSQARFDLATGTANSYALIDVTDSATPSAGFSCGAGVTGGLFFSSGTTSATIVMRQGATERMRIDSNGNALVTGSGGLGYGTGSGGTVTQATSKSTAVTLNKPTGQITMNNAALAAGTEVFFQVNNSLVSATDVVVVTANWNSSAAYFARVYYTTGGAFNIGVKNMTAGSLSDAVLINFAVIKGVTA